MFEYFLIALLAIFGIVVPSIIAYVDDYAYNVLFYGFFIVSAVLVYPNADSPVFQLLDRRLLRPMRTPWFFVLP